MFLSLVINSDNDVSKWFEYKTTTKQKWSFREGWFIFSFSTTRQCFCVLAWNDKKNYLKASHVFCGLMLKNSLGLGGGLRKTWRIPSSSSAIRLSLRPPSPVLPCGGRVFGEPEHEERGDDGALGDVDPVVGDAVQLRLNPVPLPAPRELLELAPGLPGLLPGPPPPPCCSSRMRKSFRLFSRAIRDTPPRPAGGGDAETSSLLNNNFVYNKIK